MEEDPPPIFEAIPEALAKIMQPDLLEQYQQEKQRHREELNGIEAARKRARQLLKRFFGTVRLQKEEELANEYLERVQGEEDRHAAFMQELRETIRDHADPNRHNEEGA